MHDRRGTRPGDADRRSAKRVAIRCEVEFVVGSVTYSAMAEDLSIKGAFVAAEVEVFDGLPADVTFYPPDDSEPIKIVGEIVRLARRRDERPGFAVEFGSLDEATRERILSAIHDA